MIWSCCHGLGHLRVSWRLSRVKVRGTGSLTTHCSSSFQRTLQYNKKKEWKTSFAFISYAVHLYTHPNFQRPHFQFDTVWLIDHVKLWNVTTLYFNKASLKFFLKFCNLESFGDIMTLHVILTLRHYASHRCSKMYTYWF